jgi:hypothetical protein
MRRSPAGSQPQHIGGPAISDSLELVALLVGAPRLEGGHLGIECVQAIDLPRICVAPSLPFHIVSRCPMTRASWASVRCANATACRICGSTVTSGTTRSPSRSLGSPTQPAAGGRLKSSNGSVTAPASTAGRTMTVTLSATDCDPQVPSIVERFRKRFTVMAVPKGLPRSPAVRQAHDRYRQRRTAFVRRSQRVQHRVASPVTSKAEIEAYRARGNEWTAARYRGAMPLPMRFPIHISGRQWASEHLLSI